MAEARKFDNLTLTEQVRVNAHIVDHFQNDPAFLKAFYDALDKQAVLIKNRPESFQLVLNDLRNTMVEQLDKLPLVNTNDIPQSATDLRSYLMTLKEASKDTKPSPIAYNPKADLKVPTDFDMTASIGALKARTPKTPLDIAHDKYVKLYDAPAENDAYNEQLDQELSPQVKQEFFAAFKAFKKATGTETLGPTGKAFSNKLLKEISENPNGDFNKIAHDAFAAMVNEKTVPLDGSKLPVTSTDLNEFDEMIKPLQQRPGHNDPQKVAAVAATQR